MSVLATALKLLMDAGVGGDDLVRAVAELDAAMPRAGDEAARRRREKDRAYQAGRRRRAQARPPVASSGEEDGDPVGPARSAASADSADFTDSADPRDSAEIAASADVAVPPNDIYSNPPSPLSPDGDRPPAGRTDPFSARTATALWNDLAARRGLSPCRSLSGNRLAQLKRRLAEHGENGWRAALSAVERSRFLLGETGRGGWKANIDFLLNPTHFAKALEGGYGDDAEPARPRGKVSPEQYRQTQRARADLYDRLGREAEAAEIRRELGDPPPPLR